MSAGGIRVPPEARGSLNDVVAVVTAAIVNDPDALSAVVANVENPRAVIIGLAGILADLLPAWARRSGVEDLEAAWRQVATEAAARLERGEPL